MAYKDIIKHGATEALSGEHHKHPKRVREIRTRKGHNGGYIHEHHHTQPDVHPMEEHTSPDQDSMVEHMMAHMGEQNPGEAEADASQGGIPGMGQGGAPVAGGAAPQMAA